MTAGLAIEVPRPVIGEARVQSLVPESTGNSKLGPTSHRPQVFPQLCPTPYPSFLPSPFTPCVPSFPPQVYEGGSNVDQFVTRFLLKETANQIQSLLSSVESAVEAIEEQTSQIRCVQGTSQGHVGVHRARTRASLLLGAGRAGWSWARCCTLCASTCEMETVLYLPPQCP